MNRDLWLLCRQERMTQAEMDRQVNQLNQILYNAESWSNFCTANEIIDLNRHKIIHKPHLMKAQLNNREIKAFVFVNCLN